MGIKISVIVPVFNGAKFIERCLNSIINQTYKNFEIIIIDDGSTDNSLLKCYEIKEGNKNININILTQKNSGPSAARNKGIDNSKGEYLIFVDCDDYLELDVLENMMNSLTKKDTLIKINYKTFKNNKIISYSNFHDTISVENYISDIFSGNCPGSVWGCLFDKKIIDSIRFSNDLFFLEDFLFLIEYLMRIEKVKFVDSYYYYYLDNSNSITSSKSKIINNILSFCSSLDIIRSLLNDSYIKEIDNKKIVLIEKEIAKVSSYNDLKNMMQSNDFFEVINTIDIDNINSGLYAFLLRCYKRKKILVIHCFINLRKLVKYIKNIGEKYGIINNYTNV